MQASERVLARRYAQALFEIANLHKEAEPVGRELAAALKTLMPKMELFRHPMTGAARQKTLLKNQVGTVVSMRTLRFLELLIDKKRFALLSSAVAEFGRLVDERRGVVRAHVKCAGDLVPAQADTLRKKLEAFTGKKVILETKTVPDLLGGAVVRLGDWVLDGSLRGKLNRLAAELAGT